MAGTITGGTYLYYFCLAKRGDRVAKDCDNRYFRVNQVNAAVWGWVKELLCGISGCVYYSLNNSPTEIPLCMRRMTSPKRGATERTVILGSIF
jgi:hypothetical protein